MSQRRDIHRRSAARHDHSVNEMPTFHYRALSQIGEVVSGSIAAPTAAEVGRRIEYLGLIPIDSVAEEKDASIKPGYGFTLLSRPRPDDVTIFTAISPCCCAPAPELTMLWSYSQPTPI